MSLKEWLVVNPWLFKAAWLSMVLWFLVWEALAIWSDAPRATLTHTTRDWLGNQSLAIRGLGWVFFIWLTFHMMWRLKE